VGFIRDTNSSLDITVWLEDKVSSGTTLQDLILSSKKSVWSKKQQNLVASVEEAV